MKYSYKQKYKVKRSFGITALKVIIFSLVISFFGLFFTKIALAAELSGSVKDESNNPISNTTVSVLDSNTNFSLASASTDVDGNYSLTVADGTYKVQAVPPTSSGFQTVTLTNQLISSSTVLNFILVPGQTVVTVTGYVTDRNNNPISGMQVDSPDGAPGSTSATTDSNGFYSFFVTPGDDRIRLLNNSNLSSMPNNWYLELPSTNVQSDITLDIQIPTNQVSVQVQDSNNNAVTNATVTIGFAHGTGEFTIPVTTSDGVVNTRFYNYPNYGVITGTTDGGGNFSGVVLTGAEYNISVTPPDSSLQNYFSSLGVISLDTTVPPITLANVILYTISGHITDNEGLPVSGMYIDSPSGGPGSTNDITDSNGFYSFSVTPGDDIVRLTNQDSSSSMPNNWYMEFPSTNIQSDTTFDVQIPIDNLAVHVQESNGNPIPNATVTVSFTHAGGDATIPMSTSTGVVDARIYRIGNNGVISGATDSAGNFSGIVLTGAEYNISVTPPDSSFRSYFASLGVISSDTVLSPITLASSSVIVISGRITDKENNPVSGVLVDSPNGGPGSTSGTSDTNGFYTFFVTPGDDSIRFTNYSNSSSMPNNWYMEFPSISIQSDMTFDAQIPTNTLSVRVQDSNGNAVPNATVSVLFTHGGGDQTILVTTSTGILNTRFFSVTPPSVVEGITDSSGNFSGIVLTGAEYSIGVTPPSTDYLSAFSTVTISSDVSEVFSLQFSNHPPVVGAISVSSNLIEINNPLTVSANFNDLDASNSHAASWNWGDGNTTNGIVTEANGSGSVSANHIYTTPGVYSIILTVTDNNGGTGTSEYQFVVVYDSNGGYVTGAGTINSPAGAYIANPSLTGLAHFGFSSKYEHGANIPTGKTKFRFQMADLKFESTSYDWLVVAGAKAIYKGVGTINDTGNYGFLLSAIDGDINGGGGSDKFRIKIWDKNNNDAVVYDNQVGAQDNTDPTTVVDEGSSVVIHQ